MYTKELAASTDYRDGLASEVPPFGQPAFGNGGLPDELASYGEGEQRRGLDHCLDDIAAILDEPEPVEDYHESGCELEALKQHLSEQHKRLADVMPSGAYWSIDRFFHSTRTSDGAITVHDNWICVLYPTTRLSITGNGAAPAEAVDSVLAQYYALPAAAEARAQAFGEEQERMCESDA